MTLRPVKTGIGFVLGGLQVGMDELDQPIQVLSSDGLVLLIEVVDVAVENLDEQLDGDCGVHAGVGNTQCALETLENAFTVAVELGLCE